MKMSAKLFKKMVLKLVCLFFSLKQHNLIYMCKINLVQLT